MHRGLAALLITLFLSVCAGSVAQTHVELILDASGSMFNRLEDGRYRIVAAKEVLSDFVAGLPASAELNVGLRVYGSRLLATEEGACEDSELFVPIEGLDRSLLLQTVRDTQARGATPIALSLERAAEDFPAEGDKVIVLVTDGEESCGGDVRAVVERLQEQGLDIDLRIVGFDLSEEAVRSFEGLGTFENARSAEELAAALDRAVEVAPTGETVRVEVTLTRDGAPVERGARVVLSDPVSGESFELVQADGAILSGDLPAGRYRVEVTDAFTPEPVTASVDVTPEGDNAFAFELASESTVELTVDSLGPSAGSEITVSFRGAPETGSHWLLLAPLDSPDDTYLEYATVEGPEGEAPLRLPDTVDTFEVRYMLVEADGGNRVIGRSEPFTSQAVEATLRAPESVGAGSRFEVEWQGPDNAGDFVTIVEPESPEGSYGPYTYTSEGPLLTLQAPDVAGEYEIRYVTGNDYLTLATVELTVEEQTASVAAPDEVVQGAEFEVEWRGPDNAGDYVTIVPAGADEGEYTSYAYTSDGVPSLILAPIEPGSYEVRYVTGNDGLTLASTSLTVVETEFSLEGPGEVAAGESFEVRWVGPDNPGDYVAVVPAGAPDGEYWEYAYTSDGNPLVLPAPEEPGRYELRYMHGQTQTTAASTPLIVR